MKSKNVGIITFHNAHNYGAVLQAYALHKKLSLLGASSQFIQDKEDFVGEKYRLTPALKGKSFIRYIKEWLKLLLDYKRKKTRHDAFVAFIKNYLPMANLADGEHSFDCVALGSDQIWNPNITKNIKDIYFGVDPLIKTDNVFSYAASMGNGMQEQYFTPEFKSKLSNLNKLGVREAALGEFINKKFNFDYAINLDPTLLLDKQEWHKIAAPSKSKERYLLVYEVEKNPNTQPVVDYIAKKMDLKVKAVSSKILRNSEPNEITTASPEEFLSLFANATFVVTTSFHGTVFSVINEIPFFTIKFNNGIDLRSSGILNSISLQDRHINGLEDINDIDLSFVSAKSRLADLRAESEKYLVQSINQSA